MNGFRTGTGGRIDRGRPVRFTFDGRKLDGFQGDTLASALIANGIHLVGRSFKYHRPRGIFSAGAEEPNALVTIDRGGGRETPNLRATQVEIYEGLQAVSQNRFPALALDIGAANDALSPLFPAGFYYKTFMWPRAFWAGIYEPLIRASAGLGKAPKRGDPDRYAQRYAHADALVIGGGPAGLAAALAAAEGGARVILCNEDSDFGGALLSEPNATIDGRGAADWIAHTIAALADTKRVTLLSRTTAFGYFAHNFVGLVERVTDHLAEPDPRLPRERLWQVRAKHVVIATGSIERPMVFPENDRPGITLADAARTYLNRYGAIAGKRAVVMTATDSAYSAALDLHLAGVEIAAICDLRPAPAGDEVAAALEARIPVWPSTAICGTHGRLRINAAEIGAVERNGRVRGREKLDCDLLLMSGGWTPSVHMFSQSRGKLRYDEEMEAFVPGKAVQKQTSAGACRGSFDLAACLAEGTAAGEAAAEVRASGRAYFVTGCALPNGGFIGALPHNRAPARVKAFVDFQNDVTAKDLKLAVSEGFRSIEHVKRYTTTGMATDQGKTSNMNALAIVADDLGKQLPEVGLTTFRMPYTPVSFGAIAGTARGDLFEPVRKTPMHEWAETAGAVFEDVGMWKRARYFPRDGEDMHAAVARECLAVRNDVGIFDASTLGKIEVVGPDAAEFMNRMYINAWTKLEPGRCRYGLMLTEAGYVMDDGVVGRIAADRFHVTTTTGGAPRVLHHMEDYLQTEFPDLQVWLTSTTDQWAVIAVQGPQAREMLAPLVTEMNIGPASMPHMSVRTGKVAGVPARLFRVSFSGELGFEINVPASRGREVWEAVYARGQAFGVTPYGTETMHVLRAEKGYIIVGQESDGTVIPEDLGLSGMIGKAKKDFVGKRSLMRPDMQLADRKQLVGLMTLDPNAVLEEGAQVVAVAPSTVPVPRDAGEDVPTHRPSGGPPSPSRGGIGDPSGEGDAAGARVSLGHVTSSYRSATLGRSIALAMVSGGRARMGERLVVPMPGGDVPVAVTGPVFYDPDGERLGG